jgi:hypothetical protein
LKCEKKEMVGETGLSDNVNRTLGKDAQRNNIAAARMLLK